MMLPPVLSLVLCGIILASLLAYMTRLLTLAAACLAAIVAVLLWMGFQWPGLINLGVFFLTGSTITAWRKTDKAILETHVSESKTGRRPGQVLANGGAAALLALVAWRYPEYRENAFFMASATLAAACADTVSSEFGTVYGKRFFNVLNGRPALRGQDGVISWEGTLAGVCAAALLAAFYFLEMGHFGMAVLVWLAGCVGNMADSLLGASLQNAGYMNNDQVNWLNTLTGAGTACLLGTIFY